MSRGLKIVLASVIIIVVCFSMIMYNIYGEKSLRQVAPWKRQDIVKLEFLERETVISKTVTDKGAIDRFLKELENISIKKCFIQPSLVVQSNPIRLYTKDKKIYSITLQYTPNYYIDIGYTRYKVIKGDIPNMQQFFTNQ